MSLQDESLQTRESFKDKWHLNPELALKTTLDPTSEIHQWILRRNGFQDLSTFQNYLVGKSRILDAGCGNGRISKLLSGIIDNEAQIVATDLNIEIAQRNLKSLPSVTCVKTDLDQLDLSSLGKFDFIYCQEVLHHLLDPKVSFGTLAKLLKPGGEIAIYVYGLKAPIREFSDEFIRDQVSSNSFEDSYESLEKLVLLGQSLRQIDSTIEVPDISVLGIPAGKYKVQEFIYNFFLKCFYNESMTMEENVAIASDWFHPQQASKHTLDEVRKWFLENNLLISWECQDSYGITVRGKRTV